VTRLSTVRIATRASRLALWQSEHVAALLRAAHPGVEIELLPMTTTGDRITDRALAAIGGKGLFIKELEVAMQEGTADLAVHSMKDVPAGLPDGFALGAILEREDPRDVLVAAAPCSVAELASGARVGTSSLRRRSQLLALRPDLEVLDLRGNVPTRLARLAEGAYDAIVLAAAGLKRLALFDERCTLLEPESFLPAVGQGAIGIEIRAGDKDVAALVGVLHHQPTADCVAAERAMNERLGGSCHAPVAGFAQLGPDLLSLEGLAASVDGADVVRQTARGPAADAAGIGERLADSMLRAGADSILERVNKG